jgi:hypothetical protein
MAKKLYLVFSKPPAGISEPEYHRWYEHHAQENIVSPGFLTAQRYAVEPVPGGHAPYTHLALYEYEGEMSTWRADLNRRLETKEIVLPEWFPGIQFGSFDCTALGGLLETPR